MKLTYIYKTLHLFKQNKISHIQFDPKWTIMLIRLISTDPTITSTIATTILISTYLHNPLKRLFALFSSIVWTSMTKSKSNIPTLESLKSHELLGKCGKVWIRNLNSAINNNMNSTAKLPLPSASVTNVSMDDKWSRDEVRNSKEQWFRFGAILIRTFDMVDLLRF